MLGEARSRDAITLLNLIDTADVVRDELQTRGPWCIMLPKGKMQVGNPRTRLYRAGPEGKSSGQLPQSRNPSIIFGLIQ